MPLEHPSLWSRYHRWQFLPYKWGHQELETSVIYPRSYIQIEASKRTDNLWFYICCQIHYFTLFLPKEIILFSPPAPTVFPPPSPALITLLPHHHCGFKVCKSFKGDQLLQQPDTLVLNKSALHKTQKGFTSFTLFQQIWLILNCQQSLVYVMCVTVKNRFLLHCPASMGKRNQESLSDGMNIQQHLKEILARRLMLWDLVLGAVKMTPDSLNLCKDFVELRQRNKQTNKKKHERLFSLP